MSTAPERCSRDKPLGPGLGLLIPCAQPRSSLAMGTAGRPLCSPQPSSASAEEAPGRGRVGTPISWMPCTGDRSQSIPVSQKAMPTAWAGTAGPAASLLSPSPGAPAGWGKLQLDCPLSNQLGTLELGHKCRQNYWSPHCSHQLSVSPVVFPSSPSVSLPFLGSHLLSSSCSCCWHPLSEPPSAGCSLPAPRSPHAGVTPCSGRVVTGSHQGNDAQRQHQHRATAKSQWGSSDPVCSVWDWQQCHCSREAAAGSRWALSLCSTGRDGAGPSSPSWWAVCLPPSC